LERLILPIHDTQRLSPTGAAAHMSLHLNRQCQRADATSHPCMSGQSGYRLRRRKRGRASRAPPEERHIWAANPPVNGFFQRFSAVPAAGERRQRREALKRIRPKGRTQ
jgi:hypothetical protein